MHSYSFLKRLHFIILSFVILAPWGRLRHSQSISLDHGKYSGLRSAYTDYHEIMRFVFLFFVFLLCNICYLVVKIFECFYRISPFVLMIFWYFTILSVSLLDQYGSCSDKLIWKPTRIHILLLWYFLWSVLMLALCILFQYALR